MPVFIKIDGVPGSADDDQAAMGEIRLPEPGTTMLARGKAVIEPENVSFNTLADAGADQFVFTPWGEAETGAAAAQWDAFFDINGDVIERDAATDGGYCVDHDPDGFADILVNDDLIIV